MMLYIIQLHHEIDCMELFLEPKYIKFNTRFNKGCTPPFAAKRMIYTSEERRKNSLKALEKGRLKGIKKPKQNKPVVLINSKGKPTFCESYKQAAAYLNINASNISDCIRLKKNRVAFHECFLQSDVTWKEKINDKYFFVI